ncbi:dnaJ homolog subfamily C member 1 [Poecilia reticulata]|nr:PREDICTED: dnaJ homolog subfamily C member 1 [Poecilia reticulata]
MRVCAGLSGPLVLSMVLVLVRGWEADLELLDLVEEVPQNFYEFLHLDKDAAAADIKKAYRRLSLTLHPDKNRDENAETQFRQLVAIYEVLKDEDRRRRYDDILENGLPDWRQPVFYYRRVRKMSNAELGFLLFLILTVGHYAVIWSIYLEKQLSRAVHILFTLQESGWTEDDLSLLSRLMVKFPGGTPGRWEKIAQELGRSVPTVTTKVKQMKDNVNQTSALVKLSDLKSPPFPVRSFPVDDIITQRVGGVSEEEEEEEEEAAPVLRRRNKKSSFADGWEGKVRGRRQKDFDPAAAVEEQEEAELQENMAVWTQNQQKLLELALQQFPRGTAERWDRIAKVVPGKTKEDCVTRCKMLAELVKKRKQLKS